MLHPTNELYGCKLAARDGDIGHLQDFYFDDKSWVVRYVVADTGAWLTGRLVLLSPHAFGRLEQPGDTLKVDLTRAQIEASPSIESHRPVSRQFEIDYYRHYGWPAYWDGGAMWGLATYPAVMAPSPAEMEDHVKYHHRDDKHLQSALAVKGYQVQALDGAVGHVAGFQIDDRTWAVRQMTVESGHWYSGKKILLGTDLIERISYEDSKVLVDLSLADIQRASEGGVAHATVAG